VFTNAGGELTLSRSALAFAMRFILLLVIFSLSGWVNGQETGPTPEQKTAGAPENSPPKEATGVKNIGVQEFEQLRAQQTNVVLDVRTRREYAAGHIPGAIHIDIRDRDFEKKVASLGTNKNFLVHCAIGGRSSQACQRLSRLPFRQLYNLEGGIQAWTKAGNQPER
jgi:rhodanese-related sulfurtransferase